MVNGRFFSDTQYHDTIEVSNANRWAEIVVAVDGGWRAFKTFKDYRDWKEREYARWATPQEPQP
jgi:hypothetical protein